MIATMEAAMKIEGTGRAGQARSFDLEVAERVCREAGVQIRKGQLMRNFTSLRVGGEISIVALPENESQAGRLVQLLEAEQVPWSPLGHGTNVLAGPGKIDRVAVSLKLYEGMLRWEGNRVTADSGQSLPALVYAAAERGLGGIEGLSGIPGSVGGALRMNAGAYGYEIADVIESVKVASADGVKTIPRADLDCRYRSSPFTDHDLALETTLTLRPNDPAAIKAELARCKELRRTHQPVGARSAGCIFKNPPGVATGRMIDEMGLKGTTIGGAMVSEIHANFVINAGEATAEDLFALIGLIRERVKAERDIDLEYEVEVWQ